MMCASYAFTRIAICSVNVMGTAEVEQQQHMNTNEVFECCLDFYTCVDVSAVLFC